MILGKSIPGMKPKILVEATEISRSNNLSWLPGGPIPTAALVIPFDV
jgi:hypothetical protein